MWCVRPGVGISKSFPFDYSPSAQHHSFGFVQKKTLTFLYARSIASAPLSTCSIVEMKVSMNLQNDFQITTKSERGFCFCKVVSLQYHETVIVHSLLQSRD
jgi:hypothetical protein